MGSGLTRRLREQLQAGNSAKTEHANACMGGVRSGAIRGVYLRDVGGLTGYAG